MEAECSIDFQRHVFLCMLKYMRFVTQATKVAAVVSGTLLLLGIEFDLEDNTDWNLVLNIRYRTN